MYGEFVFFPKSQKYIVNAQSQVPLVHIPHTFVCRHLPAWVRNEKVLVIAQWFVVIVN